MTANTNLIELAAVLRKYDIDPSNIPAVNGIFENGYLTIHEVLKINEPNEAPGFGTPQHEFHEWPSDECASAVLTVMYGGVN